MFVMRAQPPVALIIALLGSAVDVGKCETACRALNLQKGMNKSWQPAGARDIASPMACGLCLCAAYLWMTLSLALSLPRERARPARDPKSRSESSQTAPPLPCATRASPRCGSAAGRGGRRGSAPARHHGLLWLIGTRQHWEQDSSAGVVEGPTVLSFWRAPAPQRGSTG